MTSPIREAYKHAKKTIQLDPATTALFDARFSKNTTYLKSDGVPDHFCVGILLIDVPKKKVFLGHHIKSNKWMGAGGHIEKRESPTDAARREVQEELGLSLIDFTLYDITHFSGIERAACSEHYDFFFYHPYDSNESVVADSAEFYESGWMSFDEALAKELLPRYRTALAQLFKRL